VRFLPVAVCVQGQGRPVQDGENRDQEPDRGAEAFRPAQHAPKPHAHCCQRRAKRDGYQENE